MQISVNDKLFCSLFCYNIMTKGLTFVAQSINFCKKVVTKSVIMTNILTNLPGRQSKANPDAVALRRRDEQGNWNPITWRAVAEQVDFVAFGLETLGLNAFEMIAIFSANRPENLIIDFAAFRNRAIPVSLYSTSSREQVEYIINDAGARFAFAGDQKQYDILSAVFSNCPSLKMIFAIDPDIAINRADGHSMTLADLEGLGRASSELCRSEVEKRTREARPDDLATLIYTSGTTGEPKGAMLPHSCFDACLEIHRDYLTMLRPTGEKSLCFLPLSHIFEKAWTYFCLMMGIEVYVNQNPKEIQKSLLEVRPTLMCSVPRFWEKAYSAVQEKISNAPVLSKKLILAALKVGAKRNLYFKRLGKKVPAMLELQYKFFDRKVFAAIRKAMGVENGNIFPTAGAPLSPNIVEFFISIGVDIVIGYGLSETTATVACFPQVGYEIGSVGTPVPRVEVKIGADNEILVKGPTVMSGYYNRPAETQAAFTEDGWLRTGDAGYIDGTGAIFLTERLKDLFKTSNGKYIAPQAIESRLGEDRFIEQVAVIGDNRKYVSAIIIPAFEALKDYARRHKIAFKSVDDLVNNSEIKKFFAERIEKLQRGLAGFEKIKKFTLLPSEFTIENGELTNTLKLRRPVINNHYAGVIDAMYDY